MRPLVHPGTVNRRGAGAVRDSVRQAGFEIVQVDTCQDQLVFDSADGMRELIARIGRPGSRGLRPDERPRRPPI